MVFPENSRVIFTGDSITAATNYTARIVDYYRRNFPGRNVKFYEAAIPGSTLSHAIKYFDDLVLPFKPTHATLFFGINDCGRGYLDIEDKDKKLGLLTEWYERFLSNLSTYLDLLTAHNIMPIIFTPAPYAEYLNVDSECLKGGYRLSYEYAEVLRDEAKRRGVELVDIHSCLSEIYLHEDIYTDDRVHPTDYGHYCMAERILRAQGLDIGEYRPLEDILKDDPQLNKWQVNESRIGRLYGMYVCVKPCIYDMPTERQLEYIGEYVVTHGYGENPIARDFSTEFVVLKPKESSLFHAIFEFNGDI